MASTAPLTLTAVRISGATKPRSRHCVRMATICCGSIVLLSLRVLQIPLQRGLLVPPWWLRGILVHARVKAAAHASEVQVRVKGDLGRQGMRHGAGTGRAGQIEMVN